MTDPITDLLAALGAYAEDLRSVTWLAPVTAAEMNRRDRWLADELDRITDALEAALAAAPPPLSKSVERRLAVQHAAAPPPCACPYCAALPVVLAANAAAPPPPHPRACGRWLDPWLYDPFAPCTCPCGCEVYQTCEKCRPS